MVMILSVLFAALVALSGMALGWVLCLIRERSKEPWQDGYDHGYSDGIRDAE